MLAKVKQVQHKPASGIKFCELDSQSVKHSEDSVCICHADLMVGDLKPDFGEFQWLPLAHGQVPKEATLWCQSLQYSVFPLPTKLVTFGRNCFIT